MTTTALVPTSSPIAFLDYGLSFWVPQEPPELEEGLLLLLEDKK
jgi:hypothetical protein